MTAQVEMAQAGGLFRILAGVEKCYSMATTIESVVNDNCSAKQAVMSCLSIGITKHMDALVDVLDDHWHRVVHLLALAKAVAILMDSDDARAIRSFQHNADSC